MTLREVAAIRPMNGKLRAFRIARCTELSLGGYACGLKTIPYNLLHIF